MTAALTREERERLEKLFARAADLAPGERAAFLDAECGPEGALRTKLEWLLAGLAGEDRLGAGPVVLPSREGTQIGPYRLLEKIGEGGMGEVYAAEQRQPVERRVALKVIKPGMDSAQVVGRFEAERQALARMAHPNIAQVFDGGATDDGLPFFVMELVAGDPITEFCDRHKLSTRARLELFLAVCDGVQHAHQKGIVHRDLKPSNLLVMRQDGRAVPKVIDFGVARATTGRLAERTLFTLVGQIVGTLDYMSPEQADPTALDVDTRSDIYSLGVVLYQLVSGLLPFDHASQADVPLSEVQRAIREVDPPTPSTRLRRQTGTATEVAPLHGTDERTLVRQLAGDLDWICIKALEKDPARRYTSASELADDVRRHLAHEPVHAGRPGALYRARKFVRRNRVAVVAGVLVAAAAIAGIVGVVAGRLDAEASERVAAELRPRADAHRLRSLEREARELWPAHPEQISGLVLWQERARDLVSRLERYRTDLEVLRASAEPWSEEDRRRDRALHPRARDLETRRAELEAWDAWFDREDFLQSPEFADLNLEIAETRSLELEAEIAALQADVDTRVTWFETDQEQAAQAALSALVAGMEELSDEKTGLLGSDAASLEHGWSVPRRLAFARRLEEGFAPGGEYERRWSAVLPEIRARYPGLELTPQMGLLPLGRDPSSGLWEFAHLASGAPAERGPDGQLEVTDATGLVLVLLPGGTFLMGSQWDDPELPNYDDVRQRNGEFGHLKGRETPPIEVELEAFFLSKYEMTQAQWMVATGTNPSAVQLNKVTHHPTNPVNQVNWTECDAVTSRLGLGLPTEEQWEYAARAGTSTPWWTGTELPNLGAARANFAGPNDPFPALAPVGSFPANPFGLHDVLGNVGEWCANRPYSYTSETPSPETIVLRAGRGGSTWYRGYEARSAKRSASSPGSIHAAFGLRPVRSVDR